MNDWTSLERFWHADPHEVGYQETVESPHVYIDLVGPDIAATERYPGLTETRHARWITTPKR